MESREWDREKALLQTFTPAEFNQIPDCEQYELIDSMLVPRKSSFFASTVCVDILMAIGEHNRIRDLGHVAGPGGGLECFSNAFSEDPNRILFPDGSFVSHERTPDGIPRGGWLAVAPDMVLEVMCDADLAWDVDRKVHWYFRAGVRSVWIAFPDTRTIWVRHPDRQDRTFGPGDTVEDPGVLPGFAAKIEDLFPAP